MNNILQRLLVLVVVTCVITSVGFSQSPFLGEIILVGFNFAPQGYADCNGQLLSIAQNTALFSLLGTTYGGDGRSTFALPNLNDRIIVGTGQGPGLSNYDLGQTGGESAHTLTVAEMPSHGHIIQVDTSMATTSDPAGNLPGKNGTGARSYSMTGTQTMAPLAVAGGGQPHNNMMPYLGLKYVIAVAGIFPPRSNAEPTTTHK